MLSGHMEFVFPARSDVVWSEASQPASTVNLCCSGHMQRLSHRGMLTTRMSLNCPIALEAAMALVRGLVAGGSGLLYAKYGWLVHVLLPRRINRPSLNTLVLHKLQQLSGIIMFTIER